MVAEVVVALEVDADHGVPVVLAEVPDHAFAQYPGAVDDDVDPAEGFRALADDGAGRCVVIDGLQGGKGAPAAGLDLPDHLVGRRLLCGFTAAAESGVGDHHGGALGGKFEGDGAADAAAGAGDDGGLAGQVLLHGVLLHWKIGKIRWSGAIRFFAQVYPVPRITASVAVCRGTAYNLRRIPGACR